MAMNGIDQKICTVGKEILARYAAGDAKGSLSKSVEFFEAFIAKFLGKSVSCRDFYRLHDLQVEFYKSFDKLIAKNEVVHNEITSAIFRAAIFSTENSFVECGVAHNARCVDWILHEVLQLSGTSCFAQEYRTYLTAPNRFFKREDRDKLSGKLFLLHRNAWRAEMYTHRIYTDTNRDEGFGDMYTPLILTRMAMEQYVKFCCEKHNLYDEKMNEGSEFNLKVAIDRLKKNNVIDNAFKNELSLVRIRGNANTHNAEATWLFANLHGIDLLKECVQRMVRG